MPLASNSAYHLGRDQRRLLGGLRDHCVAGRKRGDHLAGEDREREVPRADAGEHAATAQAQAIRLAGRARHDETPAEGLLGTRRIVAEEIDRLAHFGNRVGHGLAGFRDQQADEAGHVALEPIGSVAQHACPRRGRHAIPLGLRARRELDGACGECCVRIGRIADHTREVRGRAAFPALAVLFLAADDRPRAQRLSERRAAPVRQASLRLPVGEVDASGVRALGAEQSARERDARVWPAAGGLDVRDRVADHALDRQRFVDDAVHERGVRAVLEQAPHEVRQELLVRADGRVNAAGQGAARRVGELRVQLLAHAVQALELEFPAAAACEVDDRGRRMRVVRRELRIYAARALQEDARAGQVGDVRVRLAGVDRVARQAAFLRTLDLAVPVGALHEPDAERAVRRIGPLLQVAQHVRRPLRISLDREPQPVPAGERGRIEQPVDEAERELEAVRLLGVDRHRDASPSRGERKRFDPRPELREHLALPPELVARVQRRELDRDARPALGRAARAHRAADGLDRGAIGVQVAQRIGLGESRLAEHVVGVAVARALRPTRHARVPRRCRGPSRTAGP